VNTRENFWNVYCFATNQIQQDETAMDLKVWIFSGVHSFMGKTITGTPSKEVSTQLRAQNNGQSTDNVWPEWSLDQPKTSPTSHVDWSCHVDTVMLFILE